MGTNTVIENKHFTLWYHTESKIIRHCFHKFLHGEPFRECLLAGVELISLYGAQKWLSDDRNNAAIPMEDLEWSTTVWRPKAIEAGWRHWALVLPKSVTGQMSLRDILDKFYGDSPVTYGLFNEPEIAMEWLEGRELV